jgi:hypothetical protein
MVFSKAKYFLCPWGEDIQNANANANAKVK